MLRCAGSSRVRRPTHRVGGTTSHVHVPRVVGCQFPVSSERILALGFRDRGIKVVLRRVHAGPAVAGRIEILNCTIARALEPNHVTIHHAVLVDYRKPGVFWTLNCDLERVASIVHADAIGESGRLRDDIRGQGLK